MSTKDIAKLGRLLGQFLLLFADCFARLEGRRLLLIFVRGLLSDVTRKNVEAMALDQKVPDKRTCPERVRPLLRQSLASCDGKVPSRSHVGKTCGWRQ